MTIRTLIGGAVVALAVGALTTPTANADLLLQCESGDRYYQCYSSGHSGDTIRWFLNNIHQSGFDNQVDIYHGCGIGQRFHMAVEITNAGGTTRRSAWVKCNDEEWD